jgi:hypothetical protein
MDRLNNRVRRGRQEAVDEVRPGDWLGLGAPVAVEPGPNACANRGRASLSANHTTSFLPVSGFGSGAYSAKLLAGTRLHVPDNLTNFLATVIIHSMSAVIKSLCRSRCAGTLGRHTRPAVGSCGNPQFERYACARNAEFWLAVRVWRRRQ